MARPLLRASTAESSAAPRIASELARTAITAFTPTMARLARSRASRTPRTSALRSRAGGGAGAMECKVVRRAGFVNRLRRGPEPRGEPLELDGAEQGPFQVARLRNVDDLGMVPARPAPAEQLE